MLYFCPLVKEKQDQRMPLFKTIQVSGTTRIGLWKITESLKELEDQIVLTRREQGSYAAFGSESRKKQWLGSRLIVKELMQTRAIEFCYDEYGKPRLAGHPGSLSVSHSGDFSAVAFSMDHEVGIDIEKIRDRIVRVQSRFLSAEEESMIGTESRLEKLYVLWGAKESLYKMIGRPETDLRTEIAIGPFDYLCTGTGKCRAVYRKTPDDKQFDIYYEKIGEYMLVYALDS
jgi:phosphopantetheinyl transferase